MKRLSVSRLDLLAHYRAFRLSWRTDPWNIRQFHFYRQAMSLRVDTTHFSDVV